MAEPHVSGRRESASRWQRSALTKGPLAWALRPLACCYAALVRRRRQQYLQDPSLIERLPVPVIVIGNVVAGGAGKTPATMALIRHLQAAGWQPGVVSRGYGRQGDEIALLPDQADPTLYGDEPALIRASTGVPVCVGAQRVQAARHLLAQVPTVDILLCDDGLQHYAMGRDLAIAVFDDRSTGNGWPLPAGLLREPWPPATLDALSPQLVLRQITDPAAAAPLAVPPNLPVFLATRKLSGLVQWADGSREPLSALLAQRPTLLAGIARPEAFFAMLEKQGVVPGPCLALKDHADIQAMAEVLARTEGTVLCTEKDAVKLFPVWRQLPKPARQRVGAVALELDIDPAFFAAVDGRLSELGLRPALSSVHGHETA